MSQTFSNADYVSIELAELWHAVEEACDDQIVTGAERRELRRMYIELQKRARRGALMTRVGLSVAKNARLDKNLVTELRALCSDEEKAASSYDLLAAEELALAA